VKAAKVYTDLGWKVVPLHHVTSGACSCGAEDCRSVGKHPRISKWEQKASSDPKTVAAWANVWPAANIGIATGHTFFVLDIDPDKGGFESLAALIAEHGELPQTVQQQTGSGGHHYLFALPDFEVTNSWKRLGAGIDTRGVGGQIVVAPVGQLQGKIPLGERARGTRRSSPRPRGCSSGCAPSRWLPRAPVRRLRTADTSRRHRKPCSKPLVRRS
jgi:hypothetical protein